MDIKELPDSYTVYLPSNLDIKTVLKENPPNFKFKYDEGLYLLDLIYKLSSKKDLDPEIPDSFARPHSVLMQRRVRSYRKWLSYFIQQGILLESNQYIVGKKSRGFKFSNKYILSEIREYKITDKKLIRKILTFYEVGDNKIIMDLDERELAYLYKWLEDGKLKIDYKSAKAHLKQLFLKDANSIVEAKRLKKEYKKPDFHFKRFQREMAYQKYNSRLRTLIQFNKSTFHPSIDKTAGRLHSVLTQLKSSLREFITYDNQPLVAVDIVSSQPYLATVFLNPEKFQEFSIPTIISLYNPNFISNPETPIMLAKMIQEASNKKDVIDYINAIKTGKIYEIFAEILEIENRSEAKEAFFKTIFNPNELSHHIEGVRLFKKRFPNVFHIFSVIKSSKGNHRALACTLQNFEAQLILHTACKKINEINPDIPMFTLHDSIITIPKYVEIVEKVMNEVLSDAIGIPPQLRIEKWGRVA